MILYFVDLFKAEWGGAVDSIHSPATEEHNAHMLKPVEHQEFENALLHMHPNKFPGLDVVESWIRIFSNTWW